MTFLESAAYDVRYGMRLLRRTPGLSLVAILTLALGIGGNASVLALVDIIYFRPLPIPAPERVYRVQSAFRADGDVQLAGVPGARFEALRATTARQRSRRIVLARG